MNMLLVAVAVGAACVLIRDDREGFVVNPDAADDVTVLVVNLDEHADRLRKFTRVYEASGSPWPCRRLPAVRGMDVDVEEFVHPSLVDELRRVRSGEPRSRHDQLTPGAVGCFLSHVRAWQAVASSGKLGIVFEDDAAIPIAFPRRLAALAARTPDDFEILLLGWEGESDPVNEAVVRVRRFCRTHAYAITPTAAARLAATYMPLRKQIDWELSDLVAAGRLRVYAARTQLVPFDFQGTSVQTPMI